jgi:ABC-type nitrate/sulfonate/bicarbonate transport system permease component
MLTGQGSLHTLAQPVATRRPCPWPHTRALLYAASLLGGLVLWQAVATPFSALVFPSPILVAQRFVEMLASGEMLVALGASLGTLLLGFLLAIAIGFPLGLALGRSRALSVASEPVINAIYAVPPAALVPFLIIWFGLYVQSQIALVFIMAVFEIVITMRTGTRTVEKRLIDAARSFGCGQFIVLRKVILPATLPFALTALRIGFVRALNGMITAQLLLAATGLGALMKQNMQHFDTAGLLAIVVLLSLIGLLGQEGLKLLETRLLPWHAPA